MARNHAVPPQHSAHYYRHDLLTWRRKQLGLSMREIARRVGIHNDTSREVFRGMASGRLAYPVVKLLGLDWAQVHNLKLKKSEFHLAVVNGNGSKKAG